MSFEPRPVGADGVSSKVRGALGAQYLTWNYGQMGLVATVRLSEPTENKVAWQRFLPTGPVALLPLTDELSSLVWSVNSDEARRLLGLTNECFVDALNEALWKQYPRHPVVDTATRRLDSILDSLMLRSSAVRQLQPSVAEIEPDSRASFPLAFGHSTRYVGAGVVLIGFVPIIHYMYYLLHSLTELYGVLHYLTELAYMLYCLTELYCDILSNSCTTCYRDAAHRVHPLAGQGVNLGFGDVKCLTELLAESVYSGQNIGNTRNFRSKSPLLCYETSRQRHNVPTMLAIDGFQKLYSTEATPIVVLRSLGLQLTHALAPLKSAIMNHAAV
uniref:FAD-binding domain-containing protein n=1 Tax=Timema bartmani TaxID=61472 RepID=A0A7R9HZU6_9NEOP|nr:unnamed protein product [Timema bartmani]